MTNLNDFFVGAQFISVLTLIGFMLAYLAFGRKSHRK